MTHPWLAPESPDLVWFRGADAERFLNDLISQQIQGMAVGDTRRSLLLGPDGKLMHLLWVLRTDDGYGLVTDPGRGADLAATLGRYRIRVDVLIEAEPDPVWLVVGEHDGYDVSWPGVERRLVIGEKPDLPMGGEAEYTRLRVTAGEPVFDVDVDAATIPHESGLVPVAVDFTKGCFLGQELVGRIDARGGNVPRPLRRLEAETDIAPGTGLTVDGEEVGRVTSFSSGVGMGVVKRAIEPGTVVDGDGIAVTVGELPPKAKT